jgi:FkbM family methyltransferase
MTMNVYPTRFENLYQAHPLTLVDIGASGGIMPLWEPHRRHLYIIGFEPDGRAYEALRNQQNNLIHYLNIGLHRHDGQFDFYLTRKQKDSSCFIPNRVLLDRFHNPKRFDVIEKTTIACKALDEALRGKGLTDIDFIKLDTQGSELAILEGATSILAESVFGLEVEVEFAELYQEQPLFSHVDLFVRKFGFDLINLRTVSWKRTAGASVGNAKGQLMFADALYFRQPLQMIENLKNLDRRFARGKLLRAISICQIYGFFDYGLELLDLAALNLFESSEIIELQTHLRAEAPRTGRLPNFPGRQRLADFFARLSRWLTPPSHRFKQRHLDNY